MRERLASRCSLPSLESMTFRPRAHHTNASAFIAERSCSQTPKGPRGSKRHTGSACCRCRHCQRIVPLQTMCGASEKELRATAKRLAAAWLSTSAGQSLGPSSGYAGGCGTARLGTTNCTGRMCHRHMPSQHAMKPPCHDCLCLGSACKVFAGSEWYSLRSVICAPLQCCTSTERLLKLTTRRQRQGRQKQPRQLSVVKMQMSQLLLLPKAPLQLLPERRQATARAVWRLGGIPASVPRSLRTAERQRRQLPPPASWQTKWGPSQRWQRARQRRRRKQGSLPRCVPARKRGALSQACDRLVRASCAQRHGCYPHRCRKCISSTFGRVATA